MRSRGLFIVILGVVITLTINCTNTSVGQFPSSTSSPSQSTPVVINLSTITSAPVIQTGSTYQFTSNLASSQTMTWSLAPGSLGSINSNGIYTPPTSVSVKNKMGGCQVLPNNHVFNTRIDPLPVNPSNVTWVAALPLASQGLSYLPSWGTNIADNTTPLVALSFVYTPLNNNELFPILPWPNLKRQAGYFSDPLDGEDRHTSTVNKNTCIFSEIYNNYSAGVNTSCPSCTAQSGVLYSGSDFNLPQNGTTDAAGMALAPLVLRLADMQSGNIQHALRITFTNSIIANQFIWPATTKAGSWGRIPYGARMRLKASVDISGFSPTAQILLTQAKQYGFVIADGGGNYQIEVDTNVSEDRNVQSALSEIQGSSILHGNGSYEFVDESSLEVSPSSGEVAYNNPYVTPASYASVVMTDSTNSANSKQVTLSLQGVTVGIPDPAIWIQSGVSKHLISWVNGNSNQSVTYSMSPPLGALSSSGIYTAPSVATPTSTIVTIKSVADPNSSAQLALTVMPAGPIRILAGDATSVSPSYNPAQYGPTLAHSGAGVANSLAPDYGPDSQGNMWWRNQGGEFAWDGYLSDNWYNEPWPNIPDVFLYYTTKGIEGDAVYRFTMPNGNYKVTFLLAMPGSGVQSGAVPQTVITDSQYAPMHLEAQGQIAAHNYDLPAQANYLSNTPVNVSIPAWVTDNSLYFSLRHVSTATVDPSVLLGAFSVVADLTAPHISVDPPSSPLTEGNSLQLYGVGWYMPNTVTWSVISGPGSINSNGLYVAPNSVSATTNVTIQAVSTTNSSLTATATLTLNP